MRGSAPWITAALATGLALRADFARSEEAPAASIAPTPSAELSWATRLHPTAELSIPQLLRVGAELDLPGAPSLHPFVQAGGLLYPFSSALPAVSIWGFEGGVRYRPWSENLFTLGLSAGFQQASVKAGLSSLKVDGDPIATSGAIQLRNWALKPSVSTGFRLSASLEASFEVAARIPIFSWGRLFFEDTNTGRTTENSSILYVSSNAAIGRIASLIQPEITLFRLTWRSEGRKVEQSPSEVTYP